MKKSEIKENLDKIRTSKELWKDFEYSEQIKLEENNIKCIDDKNYLNRYALAIELQYDFRESDYELIKFLLENEVIARRKDSYQGCGNSLLLLSYLLAKFKKTENVLLFQRAKDANFDTECGYDKEFIFSAGIENTLNYIENAPKDEKKILENEVVTEWSSYFSEEDIEDFIKKLAKCFPSKKSEVSLRSLFSDACTFNEIEEANRLFEILEEKEPKNYQTLYYWAKDLKRYDKAIYYIKFIIDKREEIWEKVSAISSLIEHYCYIKDFKKAYKTMLDCEKYLDEIPSWRETGLGRGLLNSWIDICLGFISKNNIIYSKKSFIKTNNMLRQMKNLDSYYFDKAQRCEFLFKRLNKMLKYKNTKKILKK